jgi:formate hydrogenlyase transcriptional activator
LGSTRTTHVNVRIVAATNRDLVQMTRARQFREDLYFRLNVFPIHLPPLRERTGDIPLLVRHYVDKYSKRMNKRVDTIPPEAMAALSSYPWPGNIRELQNFIERSVILTSGNVLRVQAKELQLDSPVAASSGGTLEEIEREHILQALRASDGVIGGRFGAAFRLGLKRTTLLSRMQKFGISAERTYVAVSDEDREARPKPQVQKITRNIL